MKILLFSIIIFLNACTNVVIADHRDYDKVQLTSSYKHCWGQCITPSKDGKSCVVFTQNISKQCRKFFKNG